MNTTGAVTGAKVLDGSLTPSDFAASARAAIGAPGERGAAGPGADGAQGETGERGPSDVWFASADGVTITTEAETALAGVTVGEGRYLLDAKLYVDNRGAATTISCRLTDQKTYSGDSVLFEVAAGNREHRQSPRPARRRRGTCGWPSPRSARCADPLNTTAGPGGRQSMPSALGARPGDAGPPSPQTFAHRRGALCRDTNRLLRRRRATGRVF